MQNGNQFPYNYYTIFFLNEANEENQEAKSTSLSLTVGRTVRRLRVGMERGVGASFMVGFDLGTNMFASQSA